MYGLFSPTSEAMLFRPQALTDNFHSNVVKIEEQELNLVFITPIRKQNHKLGINHIILSLS